MVWLVIAISLGLVAFNAALGPMDTIHTLNLLQRVAYFGLSSIFIVPICFSSVLSTLYVMRNRRTLYVIIALAVTCLIVVAPGTALVVTVYTLFHGGRTPGVSVAAIYAFGVLLMACPTGLVCYVLHLRLGRATLLNSAAIARSAGVLSGTSGSEAENSSPRLPPHAASTSTIAPEVPEQSSGAEKRAGRTSEAGLCLPVEIGQDVVYVHVSGHYVEVVTTAGSALLLMRLSDIVEALADRGMQTHRSYWVSFRHVLRLQRSDHRLLLHVTGGHKVPVSRSFRSTVRAFMTNGEPNSAAPP